MGSNILTNLIATAVSETAPTLNQNSNLKLGVRDFTAKDSNAYVYWTRNFPLKATILSAKLVFYTLNEAGSGTRGFKFTRLAVGFSDSKVVYNTRPVTFIAGDKTVSDVLPWLDKKKWELDITDWMQSIANGGPWSGFRIVPTVPEDNVLWIYSELWTDPAFRPRVEVTWSDAPGTPTGLSPAGGRAVGVAKPVVKAQFVDVSGSVALQSVQVQLNATDAWSAPTYDSGAVPWPVPEFDLNNPPSPAPAYAGLADGATTFWRIRFQDGAGIWSPWSAATTFKRDDKGVLTLNNPPSGTPKVEDATPPISWTFTGETQSAYQIQIKHKVNNVDQIDWDTGKLTSAITSLTVPTGKINEPTNTTYTITIKIWDTKQREGTPGDPPYVEIVRDFTFIPGATTGTTALTAVPDAGGKPKVVLTWQAATFPDRFNILRYGTGGSPKVIAASLDPNDTFVSGTTHTWIDRTPSPKRSLTYAVQRVVNDIASTTNATAIATVNSRGRWLQEPISGLELFIGSKEDVEMALNATESVLQGIAPDSVPVAINQSQGGLEGTMAGLLTTTPDGTTAQQWRDIYMQLRRMRVKTLYLTMDDYTFAVVAQEFTYARKIKSPRLAFEISFKFYQQDSINSILLGS
jgi:hypothetical protein